MSILLICVYRMSATINIESVQIYVYCMNCVICVVPCLCLLFLFVNVAAVGVLVRVQKILCIFRILYPIWLSYCSLELDFALLFEKYNPQYKTLQNAASITFLFYIHCS